MDYTNACAHIRLCTYAQSVPIWHYGCVRIFVNHGQLDKQVLQKKTCKQNELLVTWLT